jgi:hypothetical protein
MPTEKFYLVSNILIKLMLIYLGEFVKKLNRVFFVLSIISLNSLITEAATWKAVSNGDNFLSLKNRQIFTANGNFTVPVGITTVYVTAIGGGGGGLYFYGLSGAFGGGGGGYGAGPGDQGIVVVEW